MKHLIFVLIFLSSVSQTFGQTQVGRVQGVVVDGAGSPIQGAYIFYSKTNTSTETDNSGRFAIAVLADEPIVIDFQSGGQYEQKVYPKIAAGETIDVKVVIKLNSIVGIEVSEVIGSEVPSLTIIKPKDFEKFPMVGSFEGILGSIGMGISTQGGELTSAYSVRGGNFDENLVYINGFEVYRPFLATSGQQEGLSFINPDMVDDIAFSAGGFQARYGDKLSSVLDVKYRRPEKFKATSTLSLLGGSIHAEDAFFDKKLTYSIGGRVRSNQYLLNTLDVSGNYRPFFADVQSLVSYQFSPILEASWMSNFSQNRFLLQPQSRSTKFGTVQTALNLFVAFGGAELMSYNTYFNGLSLRLKMRGYNEIKWLTSAYNTSELERTTVEGAYRLDELENNLGASNFGEAKATLGNGYFIDHARNKLTANVYNTALQGKFKTPMGKLEWGAKLQVEQIEDVLKEWRFNDSAGYNLNKSYLNGQEIVLDELLSTHIELNSFRVMGFAQNTAVLNKARKMRLVAGVRSNYWSVNEQNLVSPRLQFSFRPNEPFNNALKKGLEDFRKYDSLKKKDWIIKFAAGYYYQPPFYRELRNFQGELNKDLKAQQSIHAVAGAEMDFIAWGRKFKFSSELYYKYLNQLVPYVVDNIRIRYYANNQGEGYAYGFDTRVNGEFIKGLQSWLNFSLMSTRENLTFTNEGGEMKQSGYIRRPTDQRLNFSILFQDELPMNPSYKMNLNLVFGTGLPYYFDGQLRFKENVFSIPAYRRVDLGLSKEILNATDSVRWKRFKAMQSVWLGLEVFNLLQVNNTISYTWVKDIQNNVYGVPNYLTSRRINLRLILKI